jgi:hypothetical protein
MDQNDTVVGVELSGTIIDRVEDVILEAEQATRPLEVEPYHGQLFELFVTAEAANALRDEAEETLTADEICRELASRWGLTDATRSSFEQQTKLPPKHLARMRMLWSVMRMWIEWSYAWQRWNEFHQDQAKPTT